MIRDRECFICCLCLWQLPHENEQLSWPCLAQGVTLELPPVHSSDLRDGIPEAAQQGVHAETVHPFPLLNAEPQLGQESSILHNPNVL